MRARGVIAAAVVGLSIALFVERARVFPLSHPASSASSQATRPSPGAPAVLHLAVEDAAGQWSEADGTGFANDVVIAAFKAAGVEVVLDVVPYARCKQMAIEGAIAGCFSMSRLPELDAAIAFADVPLFTCDTVYFQRTAKPLPASRERDLPRGTVVGVVLGYEYPPSFNQLRKDGVLVIDEAASEDINLKKLADGRLDAAVVNVNQTKPAEGLIARAGVAGKVERAFTGGTLLSFIGFSKRHPRGLEARDQFNAGDRIIRSNGVLARIEKTWTEKARSLVQPAKAATGRRSSP